jgi:hypothetical protein
MSTIHFRQTTATSPEQFIAGLTDLQPGRVVCTTTDSPVYRSHAGYTYTFTRRPDGMTDVDVVVVPEGKNLKGRLVGLVVGTVGKRFLVHRFQETVRAIEARQYGASAATSNGPTMGLVC